MENWTFEQCCRAVLRDPKANGYAKTYAQAGLYMTGEAARVQALYVLSNLDHWRGEEAKAVKARLKQLSKR